MSDNSFGTHDEREAVFVLEDALSDAIKAAKAGKFDGNEFGGGECILFMYGPDADTLLAVIQPVIAAHLPMLTGGQAILQYGPPENGIRKVSIPIPNAYPYTGRATPEPPAS